MLKLGGERTRDVYSSTVFVAFQSRPFILLQFFTRRVEVRLVGSFSTKQQKGVGKNVLGTYITQLATAEVLLKTLSSSLE